MLSAAQRGIVTNLIWRSTAISWAWHGGKDKQAGMRHNMLGKGTFWHATVVHDTNLIVQLIAAFSGADCTETVRMASLKTEACAARVGSTESPACVEVGRLSCRIVHDTVCLRAFLVLCHEFRCWTADVSCAPRGARQRISQVDSVGVVLGRQPRA